MKKRWFVVILTIGLLLHVLPLSVLALSPDPTITDSDGTLLGWSDLSTVSDVLDDSREQQLAVVDADNDEEAADDRSAGNLTPKTLDEESGDEESDDEESGDEESGDEESGGEESDDEESDDDDPADADRDEATDDLPAGNPTPPPSLLTRNWRAMALRTTPAAPQPRLCARSTRSTIRTTTPHWTMQSLPRRMVIRSTC